MDAVIGLLSMLGIIVFLIMLIIRAFRKKPKKLMVIGLIVCFVLFIIAASMADTPEDTLEPEETAINQESGDESNSDEKSTGDNDEDKQGEQDIDNEDNSKEDSEGTSNNEIASKPMGELKVHFIDVGQADSIFIDYGDYDILIDAGNNDDGPLVVNYLKQLNTDDIEIMVATHPHEDHIGGLDDVMEAFEVEKIIDSGHSSTTKTYEDYLNAAAIEKQNGAELLKDADLKYEIAEEIYFEIIEAGDSFSETNDYSVISKFSYNDIEFLFTGDAEEIVESKILNKGIEVDVLKVGHHGSSSSTSLEFLKKANPDYAVISVGKGNSYGHPNAEILSRLKALGVEIFRTDEQGSIVATTNGKTVEFNKSPIKIATTKNNTSSNANTNTNGQSGSSSGNSANANTTPNQNNSGGIVIQNIDLSNELVTIRNTSGQDVDMTGWYLLSVEGSQTFSFPSGYILKSGASIIIATGDATGDIQWTKKNIWNNKGDSGILYNNKGEAVSEFGR